MIDDIHNPAIYRLISQPQQKMKKKKTKARQKRDKVELENRAMKINPIDIIWIQVWIV